MCSWLRRSLPGVLTISVCSVVFAAPDLESVKRSFEHTDYATALKQVQPLAEQGNPDAQLFLGKMYLRGQGVPQDPDQANKWFRQAAMQGNAESQFFLGAWYLLPHRDISEGLKWMRLSAEQGNQDAQLLLGKAYLQGDLPREPAQADMWLRLAAKDNLDFYKNELRVAEGQMTPEQIAQGKALAESWKPKHGLRP
jgi:TPR repeat protein